MDMRIHSVFHAFMLQSCNQFIPLQTQPTPVESDKEYEVERILGKKMISETAHYLVIHMAEKNVTVIMAEKNDTIIMTEKNVTVIMAEKNDIIIMAEKNVTIIMTEKRDIKLKHK